MLRLPTSGALRVAVFTPRVEALRPLFEANHRLSVKFIPPSGYVPDPHADVVVLDQFAPPSLPKPAALLVPASARQISRAREARRRERGDQ